MPADDLDLLAEIEDNPERERITAALVELDTLIAAHQPHPDGGIGWVGDDRDYREIDPACRTCGTPDEYAVPWPCHHHEALTRIRTTLTGEDHRCVR